MPIERRELYASSNGDRWFLAREPETGRPFVRHEANVPSGGRVTDIDIGAFLSGGQRNPEHQALLHLIGTLVGDESLRLPGPTGNGEREPSSIKRKRRRR
jgi:hypothetical protein